MREAGVQRQGPAFVFDKETGSSGDELLPDWFDLFENRTNYASLSTLNDLAVECLQFDSISAGEQNVGNWQQLLYLAQRPAAKHGGSHTRTQGQLCYQSHNFRFCENLCWSWRKIGQCASVIQEQPQPLVIEQVRHDLIGGVSHTVFLPFASRGAISQRKIAGHV
jgi:hypothetical protein